MDVNVQKHSDKPKRRISTHSTNAAKMAKTNCFAMLKARLKVLGNSSISNVLKGQRQLSVFYVVSKIKHYKNWNYMYGESIKHTATNVPTARKKYLTRAGRNKHEMYHTIGYRFKCTKCKKTFMFESQYDEHISVHTKDNRYICRKKGCRKDYGSTHAQNYHERQHSAKAVYMFFLGESERKKM